MRRVSSDFMRGFRAGRRSVRSAGRFARRSRGFVRSSYGTDEDRIADYAIGMISDAHPELMVDADSTEFCSALDEVMRHAAHAEFDPEDNDTYGFERDCAHDVALIYCQNLGIDF